MANPRQRRKARSSSHKAVSHSNRAKKMLKKTPPIRGPKILQDAWDKHRTVRQNYAALGLVHTTNPMASGGIEYDPASHVEPAIEATPTLSSNEPGPSSSHAGGPIPKGFGKIIRDANGNVLRIELGADEENADKIGQDLAVNDMDRMQALLDPEVDKQVMDDWVTQLGGGRGAGSESLVKSLEEFSSSLPQFTSGPRHTSSLESAYLARLVQKYENDVDAMARDRRLNPEQRTAGEIRRGLQRVGRA